MITLNDAQNTLLTAQLKLANMVDANVVAETGGNLSVRWTSIKKATRGVNVVANRIGLGDTSSSAFQSAYACLTAFIGTFGGGAIDPNAQNPNTIIVLVSPQPIVIIITANVTLTPLTVPYPGFTYPYYLLRRTSDGSLDWNTNVIDTGTAFIIEGDSNDGVTFSNSYTFVVNQ